MLYFISNFIRTIFSWSYDYSSHKIIPPGVNDDGVDDDVDDDDDGDDGATEVQINFVSSQYFVTLITKSKIIQ